jgi:hypothetical protein
MTYLFKTPTVSEGPLGEGRLFSRYRLVKGVSVLKMDGEYFEVRYASEEEVQAADKFYLGGITYEVDEIEKADLEAAGYEVETVE